MLVFLDTNIWIYAYENDPVFGLSAQRFLQSLRSGNHQVAGNLFVLSELLVLPMRKGNAFGYRFLQASLRITAFDAFALR